MAVKKKELFNPMESWKATLESRQFELEEGETSKFREIPVSIQEFVESDKWLGIKPQKDINNLSISAPTTLSDPQLEFLQKATDLENGITDFVLWCGKGSGKNTMSCIVFCYLTYWLLCLRNPHAYFGRDPSKAMTLINVAANATSARRNFFDPMTEFFRSRGFAVWLAEQGFNADKDILATEINMPKNIQIVSGNSSRGSQEGYDIILALLDEVDDNEFNSVERIFQTLSTSSSTRFANKRKVIAISYRRYAGSNGILKKMYAEYKEREEKTGTAYARRFATWEFNNKPGLRESLQEYIDSKPEEAACMVESKDDDGYFDSWIKDTQRIKSAMNKTRTWIFDFPAPPDNWAASKDSEYSWIDKNGEKKYLDPFDFPIKERGKAGVKYVLACDPGLGNVNTGGDAYGVTMAHRELIKVTDLNGKVTTYPRPVIDFTFRFTGRMFKEGEIQMEAVQKLLLKLNNYGYKIAIYSQDGWNSAALSQWIARTYPGAIIMPRNLVDLRDFTALKDAIFSEAPPSSGNGVGEIGGGIDLPYHSVLFDEMKELRVDRQRNPPRVDHTVYSTKDCVDAFAKCVRIINLQYPFADTLVAGSKQDQYTSKTEKTSRFSTAEKSVSYSDAVGLGRFKK